MLPEKSITGQWRAASRLGMTYSYDSRVSVLAHPIALRYGEAACDALKKVLGD